jgi:ribosomal peptide maturation radical SAM protein 1
MKGVALCSMPFGSHRIPRLSLALFKGHLQKNSIACDLHLFDLMLASRIGFDNYETVAEKIDFSLLVSEWLFTRELFGNNPGADRKYVKLLLSEISRKNETASISGILKLLAIREKIPVFLKDCLDSIDWSKYLIAAFSTSSHQNCASLTLAKMIKEFYPDVQIVFGGCQQVGSSGDVMGKALMRIFPFIDFICQGESDISFPLLVNELFKGKPVKSGSLDGVLCRCKGGKDPKTQKALCVEDMDTLAYPDFSDYFSYLENNKVPANFKPQIPLETSRGCWWGQARRCAFCGHYATPGMAFKSKTSQRVMKEIDYLSERYVGRFHVSDDIMDNSYYKTLLPELAERKIDVTFFWEITPNITKEKMIILAKAGVIRILAGIESFSNSILKLINKGTTLLANISTLKWGKELGVDIYWNILYGFPGEDPSEYEKMVKLIPLLYHLNPPVGYSHVRFERFGSYVENPSSFGIKRLKPAKSYDLVYYGLSRDDINDIAFYFDAEYEDHSAKYEANLLEAIERWKLSTDAALDLFIENSAIKIIDTRDSSNKREFSFEGLKSRIYLLCDEAKSIQSLLNSSETGKDRRGEDIKSILDDFISEGLMIESQSRYLALAVTRKDDNEKV